ncbi:MAG: heme exporter protein CcmD [Gammaproteobacteria bacterium]|nr:heme exporter protein CcmD [Gammaproteobacteria bacterium]
MSAITEFFYFSGYAWYVWGSYGLTAAFMIAEVILVIRGKKSMVNRLARMARLNNSSSE